MLGRSWQLWLRRGVVSRQTWQELVDEPQMLRTSIGRMEGGLWLAEGSMEVCCRTSVEWNFRSNSRNIWRLLEWGRESVGVAAFVSQCALVGLVGSGFPGWRLEIGAMMDRDDCHSLIETDFERGLKRMWW